MSKSGWTASIVTGTAMTWAIYHAATTSLLVPSEVAKADGMVHGVIASPPLIPWLVRISVSVFGQNPWGARGVQILLAGLLCCGIFGIIRAFYDMRTACYSLCVLATMPAFLLQVQTGLGDLALASTVCMAIFALANWVLRPARRGWLAGTLAFFGLAVSAASAGLWMGAAIPLLSVGAGWSAQGDERNQRKKEALVCIGLGIVAVLAGCIVALRGTPSPLQIGTVSDGLHPSASFDISLASVGHGLAPWSALIPFGIVASLRAAKGRMNALSVAISTAITLGLFEYLVASRWLAAPALVVTPLFACILGVAFRRLDDVPRGWDAFGIASILVAAILRSDFNGLPDTMLRGLTQRNLPFPTPYLARSTSAWNLGWIVFIGLIFLTFFARPHDARLWDLKRYIQILLNLVKERALVKAWATCTAIAVAASAAMLWGLHVKSGWLPSVSVRKVVVHLGWFAVVAPVASVLIATIAEDTVEFLARRLFRHRRGAIFVSAGTVIAASIMISVYPPVIRSMSGTQVIQRARGYSRLGSIGLDSTVQDWSGLELSNRFQDLPSAYKWLSEKGADRRALLASPQSLNTLNRMHRERNNHTRNLPVVVSSEAFMLVLAELLPEEENTNPLEHVILSKTPTPSISLHVVLDNRIELLGMDLLDSENRPTTHVIAGKSYLARSYYRLLKTLDEGWKVFVHVDGQGRRHNGDHTLIQGQYPSSTFSPSDVIVDEYELALPTSFPPGNYGMFVGLFRGEDTRMGISQGMHEADGRVRATNLTVQ